MSTARLVTRLDPKGGRFGIHLATDDERQPLNIGLRTTKIERELSESNLPKETRDILQEFIDIRHSDNANRYRAVLLWIELRGKGSWWQDVGCASPEEFLIRSGLPIGQTLAKMEAAARMFSRDTFLLVGPKLLGEMETLVLQYQADRELRVRDYATIFTNYTKEFDVFDQEQFRRHVRFYVNETYLPKPEVKNLVNPPNPVAPPPKTTPFGTKISRVMVERPSSEAAYVDSRDHVARVPNAEISEPRLRVDRCSSCVAALDHIRLLEAALERRCGREAVPPRPSILRSAS